MILYTNIFQTVVAQIKRQGWTFSLPLFPLICPSGIKWRSNDFLTQLNITLIQWENCLVNRWYHKLNWFLLARELNISEVLKVQIQCLRGPAFIPYPLLSSSSTSSTRIPKMKRLPSPASSAISTLAPSMVPMVRAPFSMNFMLPVPEASVPAVEICSDRSAAGMAARWQKEGWWL